LYQIEKITNIIVYKNLVRKFCIASAFEGFSTGAMFFGIPSVFGNGHKSLDCLKLIVSVIK